MGIAWSHGSATVSPLAAMLLDARFDVDGRVVRPFARAEWTRDQSLHDAVPAGEPEHIRALGGDFVALPFGSAEVPSDAGVDWAAVAGPANDPPHGRAADAEWDITELTAGSVTLALDLPVDDPFARLERTIRGIAGQAAIEFELRIHARRPHRAPLGLHPIFRMPEQGETLTLASRFASGRTYPGSVASGSALLIPGAEFAALDGVPGPAGPVDISRLPFAETTEEVVQLLEARSPVSLTWSSGYSATLEWDDEVLPSVLLWISDRHLQDAPWNGRYRGLGVEPIASAFDFPASTSTALNPLARAGSVTSVRLNPHEPLVLHHRVIIKGTT
ncbi:hypothetical protein DDQ50_01885 [Amnibacterium flavum]|uniref:Aldose 1-epimerase n=1 Tax=Amnibacterium flavum TaxID=2173173 RepID=A0A2V1HRW7_9MICO|nr:hypothetical protein DDQ50_01885 [Amnibacterium flavum]